MNRVRIPIGGTASYSAISNYPGYPPSNAADGTSSEWAPNGHPGNEWWQVDWTAPQVLERVVLRDRVNTIDKWGAGYLLFNDGTTVPYPAIPDDGSPYTVYFPEKRDIISMRVQATGTIGQNPGLREVEAY